MHIYFVRHGETLSNRSHVHQGPDVPLSEVGKAQIEKTAEYLSQFPITKIITSDLVRARESAGIIGEKLNLQIDTSQLFREVRRPNVLYGKSHLNLKTLTVGISIMLHARNPEWRYADGENLLDVRKRIGDTVNFLKTIESEHDHVVVVSHSFIINLFAMYMCDSTSVRVRHYLEALLRAAVLKNGSITKVTYTDDENPNTCDWNLEFRGSDSHLTS